MKQMMGMSACARPAVLVISAKVRTQYQSLMLKLLSIIKGSTEIVSYWSALSRPTLHGRL